MLLRIKILCFIEQLTLNTEKIIIRYLTEVY